MALTILVSGTDSLVLQADLPAYGPEELYEHWTRPELLRRWWAPTARIEPQVGGDYLLAWPDQARVVHGRVLEALRGHRLSFSWRHAPDSPERQVHLEFEPLFEPLVEGGTKLTLRQGPYGPGEAEQREREAQQAEWAHYIARLGHAHQSARTGARVLHATVTLRCSAATGYRHFTENGLLARWLCEAADVEPVVGGRFELFWEPKCRERNSTIGCKVTAAAAGKLLAFEWKGPEPFKAVMNEIDPLTHVVVAFLDTPEGAELQLVHSGWGAGPEWEEARDWFERSWGLAFARLAEIAR